MTHLREHQLRALDALKYVDVLCKKNDIQYFLIAGSALGAVRHKGIIPWDDDIDIGLRVSDFRRFSKLASCFSFGPFVWKSTDTDTNYPRMNGNILYGTEPLITVFPIVKVSNNYFLRYTQWWIRKVISPIYQIKSGNRKENPSLKKKVAYFIGTIIGICFTQKTSLKLLRWNEERYNNKTTIFSINLYSKYSMKKELIKNEWICEIIRIPFEDGMYPVFKSYHDYLTHLYGDYMTPPGIDLRHGEHESYHI